MGLGLPEIIIIIVAAAVLLFGGKKIIELSRSMGRASGEFKKARREVERELTEVTREETTPSVDSAAKGTTASVPPTEHESADNPKRS
jgi:Sec-independent protein secretion pathway components